MDKRDKSGEAGLVTVFTGSVGGKTEEKAWHYAYMKLNRSYG